MWFAPLCACSYCESIVTNLEQKSNEPCKVPPKGFIPIADSRSWNSPSSLPPLLTVAKTKARRYAARRFWSKVDWGTASVRSRLLRHKVCLGTRLICGRRRLRNCPLEELLSYRGATRMERQLVRSEIWIKRHLFDSPSRGCRQTIKQKTKTKNQKKNRRETRTTLFDFKRIEFCIKCSHVGKYVFRVLRYDYGSPCVCVCVCLCAVSYDRLRARAATAAFSIRWKIFSKTTSCRQQQQQQQQPLQLQLLLLLQ